MSHYEHIMLAVDFNKDAKVLIEKAVQRARCEHARLSAIHIHINPVTKPYHGMFDINLEQANQAIEQASVNTMKSLTDQCDYPVEYKALRGDSLAMGLTEVVKAYNVELLMMGHHRHSWLGEVFGSTSEPVVRKMPCDILLFKV